MKFFPDGSKLATLIYKDSSDRYNNNYLLIWDTIDYNLIKELCCYSGSNQFDISPDGSKIILIDLNNFIVLET